MSWVEGGWRNTRKNRGYAVLPIVVIVNLTSSQKLLFICTFHADSPLVHVEWNILLLIVWILYLCIHLAGTTRLPSRLESSRPSRRAPITWWRRRNKWNDGELHTFVFLKQSFGVLVGVVGIVVLAVVEWWWWLLPANVYLLPSTSYESCVYVLYCCQFHIMVTYTYICSSSLPPSFEGTFRCVAPWLVGWLGGVKGTAWVENMCQALMYECAKWNRFSQLIPHFN